MTATQSTLSPIPGIQINQLPSALPLAWSQFKLIAFDMDSTLINIECIDEIADCAGRKEQVAAITEAAMQGHITDYKESLRQRVALLKGVTEQHLHEVYEHRLQFNPGAKELIQECKKQGLATLLVSGGFTFFSDRVIKELGIDQAKSNLLEIKNGVLTGGITEQTWGDICDGEEKKKTILEVCQQLGIKPSQCIAVGDGANDLPMMSIAGLSVAYHAKPKVQAQAMVAINQGGLDQIIQLFCAQ